LLLRKLSAGPHSVDECETRPGREASSAVRCELEVRPEAPPTAREYIAGAAQRRRREKGSAFLLESSVPGGHVGYDRRPQAPVAQQDRALVS
jgi:hypothetical protein